MAGGYFDYSYKSKFGEPEDSMPQMDRSYLTGSSGGYEGSSDQSSMAAASSGAGAAAGMSSPAAAGLNVAGSFLSNYLAQKAADERERRQRESQNIQQYADNQGRGLDMLMATYKGALR